MAVSDQEVAAWLAANPLATDAQIAAAMDQYGVSPAQMARVTGLSVPVVEQRKAAAQRKELQSTFDPRVAESQYTLPSQRRGTMAERGDDYQIYEEVAKEGPLTYYQTYDAYGNATGTPFAINTGDNAKDFLNAAVMFGSVVGAPWLSSVIGAAAPTLSNAAVQGLTGAAIGGGGTLVTGGSVEDALKNALIAGGTAYAGSSLFGGADTQAGLTDRQLAIADAKQLADAGLNTAQIQDVLSSAGFNDAIISRAIGSIGTVPADGVLVTAPRVQQPIGVMPGLLNAAIAAPTVTPVPMTPAPTQTIEIVGEKPRDNVVVPTNIGNIVSDGLQTTPITADQVVEIVSDRPRDTIPFTPIDQPVIPAVITPTPIDIPEIVADKKDITAKDVIDTIGAVGTVAGLVDAATSGDNGFDIVDIPSEWRTPTYGVPGGSAWPGLTPIDFGTRELLRGTQWERFINQPVAQIPVVQPQQMNMSYADLVSALQGNQGPRLTINDVISGIQGQYGQVNPSAMG